jgi:hypothetical protein
MAIFRDSEPIHNPPVPAQGRAFRPQQPVSTVPDHAGAKERTQKEIPVSLAKAAEEKGLVCYSAFS